MTTELDEKLKPIIATLAGTNTMLQELVAQQHVTDRQLKELIKTVRDLATIVASHERRLNAEES